jgi:hypothetical protein
MKRILLGLAVAALATATAKADPGGFAPPAPSGGLGFPTPAAHTSGRSDTLVGAIAAPPAGPPDRYGMLPGLRKLFSLDKGCSTCKDCGGSHRGGSCGAGGPGGPGGYGMAPPVNQGTLVFPHHPYVRAPRDFFMYEPGR